MRYDINTFWGDIYMLLVNVDNYEKLDSWFDMFKSDSALSIKDAKILAKRIKECGFEDEKRILREKLLLGTISEVYKFVKNSGILFLCDTGFVEFDDLISSLTLAWFDKLDEKLLNVSKYKTLFNRKYFEVVAEKLGIEDLSGSLKIRGYNYVDVLANYYYYKENNYRTPSFDFCFSTVSECTEECKEKSIDIIEKGYQLYKDYSFINSDNVALLGLYGVIFTSMAFRKGQYGCNDKYDFTDEVNAKIDVANLVLQNKKIRQSQQILLFDKYGLDGREKKDMNYLSELYGVDIGRLRYFVSSGLKSLSDDKKIMKYYKK